MHVFLQGPRHIGKSTVIRKTLDILTAARPLMLGGFITWNGGKDDPHIYMRAARKEREKEIYRLAKFGAEEVGMVCDTAVFETAGVRLLFDSPDAELIIMDELGFLESSALKFRQAVLDTLAGRIPVFGVMRMGSIPWHDKIKRDPKVTLINVNESNRNELPGRLADMLVFFREQGTGVSRRELRVP